MSVITISRMYGSGGSDVAERVAAALGWTLLDNALLDAVAERLGVPRSEVEAREERPTSLVERLANALAVANPELAAMTGEAHLPPSEDRVLAVTEHVVAEAAQTGHTVLVGRGAQAMLAARGDALHVFCAAPRQALVERIARRRGIATREAEREVDETNRRREQYVRKHWGRSWSAPENYHVCVNTAWLGVSGAASLIIHLARERFEPSSRD
jgi:cytidylate kinase